MITLGEMQIAFLNDGTTHVDAGGVFGLVPRALFKHFVMPDEENLVPMTMTCLLVRANGKIVVIDTGLGSKLNDKARAHLAFGGARRRRLGRQLGAAWRAT
jgi:hypothetical protein